MKKLLFIILLLPVLCKAQSAWVYSDYVDEMTSKTVYQARVTCPDKIQFKFPYEGGSTATIAVASVNGHNQVMLMIDKGQFIVTTDGMDIQVRFDDKKAQTFRCSQLSNGDINKVFINSDNKFISLLKSSKIVIIQAPFYQEPPTVLGFDVHGFDWKH